MNACPLPEAEGAASAPSLPPMREDLKLSALFGVASALAALALIPYVQLTMPEALAKIPLPLPLVLALQSVQAFVILTLASLLCLRAGHRVGLGAPWLRALVTHRPRVAQPWLLAAACGLAAGLLVVGLDPLFMRYFPKPLHALPQASGEMHAVVGFLASFYGGIVEELELRLVCVTLIAWLLWLLSGKHLARWQLWTAVVVAAIGFGAGHLPAASNIWPLDTVVIVRTVLLNGFAGLVFGWFYVRNGIESAMLSHFCADLVLHVAAPLLMT